jgi:hypothetical protein
MRFTHSRIQYVQANPNKRLGFAFIPLDSFGGNRPFQGVTAGKIKKI